VLIRTTPTVAEGNKKLQIDLEDLGSGTYTVEWKVLATDQHYNEGQVTFNVAIAEEASNTSNSYSNSEPKPTHKIRQLAAISRIN